MAGLKTGAAVLAASIGLLCAACGRGPARPYALHFALGGTSPWLLTSAGETTVALTVTNTGQRAWDPARIHLSYHWLWLVPREIASRSRWSVPYQDGIRTDLPQAIPPAARIALAARLLAPRWPGLYWLQWDMVEEGVTWFAQVSPRQPRTLVVVLPPLAWMVAPLPLLAALVGLFAVARTRRKRLRLPSLAPIADAVWCATALAAKPLIVVHEALLEPTATAYWLMLAAAVVPSTLGLLVLPRRARAWTLTALGIFGSLVVLGDVVYYRFFGDVLSAPAVLAAGQTGHLWGSIRSLISPVLIWLVVDWPFAVLLAGRVARLELPPPAFGHRARTSTAVAAALVVSGMLVSAPRALSSVPFGQVFRDRAAVEELSLFGFHVYDVWNYARSTFFRHPASEDDVRVAASWFAERAPLRSGAASPAFGAARGRNLIVVQVESLQDFAVDYRVADEDVMPHLKHWTDDSLRFTRVTDETNQGRTSDAEFATMTSLLPMEQGAVAFRYPANHYTALPRILAERGYATLSAVPFEPGFWNRRVMHPAYGFQHSFFESDFQMTEQIGWGLNDRDFLQQMVPRLERQPQPFAAWLITVSLHHPFDHFPEKYKVLRLGALEGTSFGNYLHTMRFFDSALELFKQALARDGLLDRSVLVVFGDHDAGFARAAALSRTIGIDNAPVAWARHDRVPFFVRLPQPASDERGTRATAAGQTDFAPTLLALVGVDATRLPYVGRNLLASPDGPVPRPYGEWIDDRHFFFTQPADGVCYDLDGHAVARDGCAESDAAARREREISRLVVTGDLQPRLRVMLENAQR